MTLSQGDYRAAAAADTCVQKEQPRPMDITQYERWLRPPWAVVVAVLAGGAVAAVVFAPIPRAMDDPTRAFLTRGTTVLWLAVLVFQGAVWAFCAPAFRARLAMLSGYRELDRVRIGVSTGVVVLTAAVPVLAPVVLGPVDSPLPGHAAKMLVLSVVGLGVAVPGILGVFRVDAAVTRDFDHPSGTAAEVLQLNELRGHLARFGALLSIIVGLAMLSSGGLRNALSAEFGREVLPLELVWVYGGYFSGLLAIIYIPAYVRLLAAGGRLADQLCPPPAPWTAPNKEVADLLGEYVKRREMVEQALSLHVGAVESFRTAAFIASPLAAALFSSLVGLQVS